jgi:CBS domain-containing protein
MVAVLTNSDSNAAVVRTRNAAFSSARATKYGHGLTMKKPRGDAAWTNKKIAAAIEVMEAAESIFCEPRQWNETRVRDVMTLDVACVRPHDSVEYAARLMRERNCGAIPVVDRDGRLTGMITDRDIAVRLVARGSDIRRARVDDCMTDEGFACLDTDSINNCMRSMSRNQVRRMPIVDSDGRVVGIVSQSDLAHHAEEHRGSGERRAVADVLCAVSERSALSYR